MRLAGVEEYAEFIARKLMPLGGVEAEYAEFITRELSTDVAPFTLNASYDRNFLRNSARLTFHLNTTVKGQHADAI